MKKYKVCDCCETHFLAMDGIRKAIDYRKNDLVAVNNVLHDKECKDIFKCPLCNEWLSVRKKTSYEHNDGYLCSDCEQDQKGLVKLI